MFSLNCPGRRHGRRLQSSWQPSPVASNPQHQSTSPVPIADANLLVTSRQFALAESPRKNVPHSFKPPPLQTDSHTLKDVAALMHPSQQHLSLTKHPSNRFEAEICPATTTAFRFRLGSDFGRGGGALLNGRQYPPLARPQSACFFETNKFFKAASCRTKRLCETDPFVNNRALSWPYRRGNLASSAGSSTTAATSGGRTTGTATWRSSPRRASPSKAASAAPSSTSASRAAVMAPRHAAAFSFFSFRRGLVRAFPARVGVATACPPELRSARPSLFTRPRRSPASFHNRA